MTRFWVIAEDKPVSLALPKQDKEGAWESGWQEGLGEGLGVEMFDPLLGKNYRKPAPYIVFCIRGVARHGHLTSMKCLRTSSADWS